MCTVQQSVAAYAIVSMRERNVATGAHAPHILDEVTRLKMAYSSLYGFLMTAEREVTKILRDIRQYSRQKGIDVLVSLSPT